MSVVSWGGGLSWSRLLTNRRPLLNTTYDLEHRYLKLTSNVKTFPWKSRCCRKLHIAVMTTNTKTSCFQITVTCNPKASGYSGGYNEGRAANRTSLTRSIIFRTDLVFLQFISNINESWLIFFNAPETTFFFEDERGCALSVNSERMKRCWTIS